MKLTRRDGLRLAGAAAITAAAGTLPARAATVHEVQMLNQASDSNERNVFEPALLRAEVGDTIKFVPTDRGHNSKADEDMMPDGGEAWDGGINEEVEITLETPGAYGYYCTPHRGTGMVGLILVGEIDMEQYEATKEARQRGRARARYEEIFAEADELLASENS
ncbi:MAG: pseudoazurin [Pseudomonadota bacterium]